MICVCVYLSIDCVTRQKVNSTGLAFMSVLFMTITQYLAQCWVHDSCSINICGMVNRQWNPGTQSPQDRPSIEPPMGLVSLSPLRNPREACGTVTHLLHRGTAPAQDCLVYFLQQWARHTAVAQKNRSSRWDQGSREGHGRGFWAEWGRPRTQRRVGVMSRVGGRHGGVGTEAELCPSLLQPRPHHTPEPDSKAPETQAPLRVIHTWCLVPRTLSAPAVCPALCLAVPGTWQ